MTFRFEKASRELKPLIFDWLKEPHMQEFWDNSEEHRSDITNFINGDRQSYFAGTAKYWVGFYNDEAFSFILSDEIQRSDRTLPDVYRRSLSHKGRTIALDFGIGNPAMLGKALAAPTLIAFMNFYRTSVDKLADTFFIDPELSNGRARHVYEKAGFRDVGFYDPVEGAFVGHRSVLMVRKF